MIIHCLKCNKPFENKTITDWNRRFCSSLCNKLHLEKRAEDLRKVYEKRLSK
jgi:hypothetical protein